MRLSVVMAAMNESTAILGMIEEIKMHTPFDTEILVIDSSTDNTGALASGAGARVIKQAPNGHGEALKTGLKAACGDIIITMDCDLTYPTHQIPQMVECITKKRVDIVSGCRLTSALKKEMPYANKLANALFAFIVRLFFGVKTHDVTTGMFVMTKHLAQLPWKGNHSLPAEIIIRSHLMGKKYLEVPIDYKIRIGETTLKRWRSGKCYLRCFFHWKWGWFAKGEL